MESQCAVNEEREISRAVFEYKEVPPHLDTVNLSQPKGLTYLEIPNEAGLNIEKERRIPKEEEVEDQSQDTYNLAERMFMELHPNEQNEIIIKVFKERNREITALHKDLEYRRNLYFESIINGI